MHVVDSTVCRVAAAQRTRGTLLSFVGGFQEVVARSETGARLLLDRTSSTRVGRHAQVAKAANNLVMWSCLVADHEALALAKRFGMDVEVLREALLKSSAENYPLRHWGTNTMAWADDDMEIVQSLAHEVGVGLPQAGLNRELCRTLKSKRFRLDEYGV